ncbi:MAG: winged helix-turn-helix transcriptional regulator [Thermoplasmatales archaeon]|nr:winged helix-turn-helix transcriptional regulator [Thermoplasmatales archaeon]
MEKVVLEKDSFMALASDTRINLLKKLDERKMTVSELAREMSISKPAVLKHLSKLCEAGLVKKIEGERKWIYYSLTQKGKNILYPDRAKIILLLSSSIAFLVAGVLYMIRYMEEKSDGAKILRETLGNEIKNYPYLGIILFIISAILLMTSIFYKIRNRKIG